MKQNRENYSLEQYKKEFINDLTGLKKQREGMDKLLKYLEKKSDFFQAPAFTSGPESCAGGLLRHSVRVMSYMLEDISELGADFGLDASSEDLLDSIMIVSHLSGIWKANYYKSVYKTKKDADGNEVNCFVGYRPKPEEDRLCFGKDDDHGDEAVYILQGYISLNRNEALAIRIQDWDPKSEEAQRVFRKNPLALFFYMADLKARYDIYSKDQVK